MATVVDQLKQFRYVTSSRGLPWPFIRAVNVSQLKTESPDLQQLKNIVSAVSDCRLDDTALNGVSPSETLQLLCLAQVAVQFLIHSQGVMKLQLADAQNRTSVNTIASQHLLSLESKVEALKKKLEEAEIEKQSMRQVIYQLEKGTVELHTKAQCLEKDLEFERTRRQQVVQMHMQQEGSGEPNGASAAAAAASLGCRKCGRHKHQHESRHRHEDPYSKSSRQPQPQPAKYRSDGLVEDDALSGTTLESDASSLLPQQRHRRSSRPTQAAAAPPPAATHQFVDWPSFAMLMLQQQKAAAVVPAPTPTPVLPEPVAPRVTPVTAPLPQPEPEVQAHTQRAQDAGSSEAIAAALQLAAAQEKSVQELRGVTESIAAALASQATSTKLVSESLAKLDAKVTEQALAMERSVHVAVEKFDAGIKQVRDQLSNAATKDEVRSAVREEVSKQQQQLRDVAALSIQDLQLHGKGTSVPSTEKVASSQPASRAGSPMMLPPLPLASVVQDPDGAANGQQLITPSSVQGFGPRVVSESHVTSDDDDDDDPYVPLASQLSCKHCQEKHPNIERHQATCPKRQVQCQYCKATMTAGESALHKCPNKASATAAAATGPSNASGDGLAQSQAPANLSASRIVVDGSAMVSDVSVASSTMQRKASSKMLKDTQDELERLLAEEAADEARRRSAK